MRISIPLEFLKAIGEKPPYVRIYWVKWLADYTHELLNDDFVTKFRDDMLKVGKDLTTESIKEAYEFGMPYFKDGFIFSEEKKKKTNTPEQEDFVRKVIDYLNQKCLSTYTPTKPNTECILARAKEGYSIGDFKLVIDTKTSQWMGTDQQKYLRPITLFQAKKFENYLNEPKSEINGKPKSVSSIDKLTSASEKAKQFFSQILPQ
jgi:uncharacterized phage protein (TIGR02220 family)